MVCDYQNFSLDQGDNLTFCLRPQGNSRNCSKVLTHLLTIHLDPVMTGPPPWPTALSLEVSPPAQERTVEPGPGLDFGIEDVREGGCRIKKEMMEFPSLRF